jgi:copper(I)-binding protein
MVSRETTRPLRKLLPAVAIGVSALLGVVGCGAGQVAQTAEMEPAVNGNMAQVDKLVLRDVMVAFPDNGEAYAAGEDAPLVLTIANTSGDDDELVGVTSPAGTVEIVGNARIPAHSALQVVRPGDNPNAPSSSESSSESSAPSSSGSSSTETTGSQTPSSEAGAPSSESSAPVVTTTTTTTTTTTEEQAPDVVGTISLVITGLTGDLPFGKTVPVTFEFAKAGKVTVSLPIGAPTTARPDNRDDDMVEGEGH